jgi:hypothetical protein
MLSLSARYCLKGVHSPRRIGSIRRELAIMLIFVKPPQPAKTRNRQ